MVGLAMADQFGAYSGTESYRNTQEIVNVQNEGRERSVQRQ
jgi:hypothetical protein